ncbi:MAG: DUF4097 domain-containing protein [Clostridia bacterium]|nr:DUF4097 domain-containing protein [Clostridia bacterium]
MKKLTVLLLTVVSVVVFALTGCSNGDTFTGKSYLSGETQIEKVSVQVENRELEISASEDNKIYIDYFDGEKEYLDITVSESKELTIKLLYNKNWTDYIGIKTPKEYRKIKIRLPDNLIVAFKANTTNENITINSLSFKDSVNLQTGDGNIVCERVNVGNAINLTVKNGDITGSIIGGWDDFAMHCTIKKGNCNLPALKDGGEKSFTADCNNGNINIQFVK